jgi:hypothetical protein
MIVKKKLENVALTKYFYKWCNLRTGKVAMHACILQPLTFSKNPIFHSLLLSLSLIKTFPLHHSLPRQIQP